MLTYYPVSQIIYLIQQIRSYSKDDEVILVVITQIFEVIFFLINDYELLFYLENIDFRCIYFDHSIIYYKMLIMFEKLVVYAVLRIILSLIMI